MYESGTRVCRTVQGTVVVVVVVVVYSQGAGSPPCAVSYSFGMVANFSGLIVPTAKGLVHHHGRPDDIYDMVVNLCGLKAVCVPGGQKSFRSIHPTHSPKIYSSLEIKLF